MEKKIGQTLKNAREAADMTVDDVVNRAKIPRAAIEALEADDITYFTCPLYAQSFLRQYGDYIGLDVEPWMDNLFPAPAEVPAKTEFHIDPAYLRAQFSQYVAIARNSGLLSKPVVIILSVLCLIWIASSINRNFEADSVERDKAAEKAKAEMKAAREVPVEPVNDPSIDFSTDPEPPKRAIIVELPPQ
jgi:cytoskeletal protein RodZ